MTRATRILSVLPALLLGVFVMSTAHAWAQAGPVGTSVQQYSGGVRWPDVAYDSYNRVFLVVWGPGTISGPLRQRGRQRRSESSFRISDSHALGPDAARGVQPRHGRLPGDLAEQRRD